MKTLLIAALLLVSAGLWTNLRADKQSSATAPARSGMVYIKGSTINGAAALAVKPGESWVIAPREGMYIGHAIDYEAQKVDPKVKQ